MVARVLRGRNTTCGRHPCRRSRRARVEEVGPGCVQVNNPQREDAIVLVAIYARKSTEQTRVSEEARSVTLQVENARAFAASKGWVVADEYVFTDDGISGAEFKNRPGFAKLMAAVAQPRPPFEVLVMSEPSRLGR